MRAPDHDSSEDELPRVEINTAIVLVCELVGSAPPRVTGASRSELVREPTLRINIRTRLESEWQGSTTLYLRHQDCPHRANYYIDELQPSLRPGEHHLVRDRSRSPRTGDDERIPGTGTGGLRTRTAGGLPIGPDVGFLAPAAEAITPFPTEAIRTAASPQFFGAEAFEIASPSSNDRVLQ
jgi:hypothetical protein